MNIFSKRIEIFFSILIIINIALSAYQLLHGDIHYDVDVSRDFLVMNDIIENQHLTLLGPRSGAIPGIFHGPLWFYVNLPAFLIGGGNPLVVGWFWFILSIVLMWIVFWVAKKLFGFEVAILSALLFSVNSIINPSIGLKNFYNPFGAVFLFPVFFFLFYQYYTQLKLKYLILSLFILGLLIQFQMAFGIPILFIATVLLGYLLVKKKKLNHFIAYLILFIPLSTFILFDIKHKWLQFNAFVDFMNNKNIMSQNLFDIIGDRLQSLIFGFFDQLSPGQNFLTIFYAIFFLYGFFIAIKKSASPQKIIYWLFGYLFLGFWIISLLYSGGIGNYYWPFLPLAIILFCSFSKVINRKIFIFAFLILYIVNLYAGISAIVDFKVDINKRGPHSWAFNYYVAQGIYKDAKGDFGYFNFSPDRFAYQQRYAMIYANKDFPSITSFSSVKKPLTYLIEVDPPKDRPELNSLNWRISDVGIDRLPDKNFRFDFIQIEKYFLNGNEIQKTANPYLLDNVFLR